jgi:U4/U6.U5 tri-snRNP-associated protein 3
MSDSRSNYRDDDNHDNVESYRGRRREEDRRSSRRDRSPDDYDADRKKSSSSSSTNHHNHTDKFQSERAQRMARLRQEMKEEDRELAALDNGKDQPSKKEAPKPQEAIIEVKPEELEGLDEEEQMRKLLGFEGFGSTNGEAVEDNQSSAARGVAGKHKARKYRQYMNRKSGFNRPLESMD